MNITMENKKQKAIELMKKLDIYEPYIRGFERDNLVCYLKALVDFGHIKNPNL